MKILLPITLLILTSTSSYGAFNTGERNSGYGGGYKTDVRNGDYNDKGRQTDFYGDNINDASGGASPKGNNVNKTASPAAEKEKPATIAKEKEEKPVAVVPKSSPDAGKKIQKVTKGDVVTYSWASPTQLAQNEPDSEVEIITVKKSGFSGVLPNNSAALTCKVRNMGVNLEGIKYYSAGMPFNDIARMSLGWIRSWGSSWEGVELDLDDNGYLKTVDAGFAQTIISDDNWGRNESDKRYVLLYDGEGKLEFNLNKAKIIKSGPGRIEIELPKGRTGMKQISTNPSNYLRNIRIIPIEYEGNDKQIIVQEQFKDIWKGLGVVRYLNTQATNHSTEVHWQDRPKPNKFGAQGGQSIEDIIHMSNEMNVNPWLLAPHMANDDYFRQMATYVKDNLNSNLKVYIEYTNEAWNSQFPQTKYLSALSKKKGTTQYQEYGQRAKRLFDIWLDVFGNEDRIVRVIGTQFTNPWVSEQIMKTPGLEGSVDALAVGYYIGHELGSHEMASTTLTMNNDEIFNHLHNKSLPKAKKHLLEQKAIADAYNLELVAYEAGQHLVAANGKHPTLGRLLDSQEMTDKLISINRDSKMTQLYADMYNEWNDVGGGLMVWFATTDKADQWGSWGLLESMGQNLEHAPKYQAIQQMLSDQGCVD